MFFEREGLTDSEKREFSMHRNFTKFIESGTYKKEKHAQILYCSFLPALVTETENYTKKWNISIKADVSTDSDVKPWSFRSESPEKLMNFIISLIKIYFDFIADTREESVEIHRNYTDALYRKILSEFKRMEILNGLRSPRQITVG